MVDYAKLAEKAKALQDAAKNAGGQPAGPNLDPVDFYNKVKSHLMIEINNVNSELRKRALPTLERTLSPGFSGRFCFTSGTSLLYTVELDLLSARHRIRTSVSGPPNGNEIARREYLIDSSDSQSSTPVKTDVGVVLTGLNAKEVAVDIVSSIISGEFS